MSPWPWWRQGFATGRQSSGCHRLHVSPLIAAVVLQESPLTGTKEQEKQSVR